MEKRHHVVVIGGGVAGYPAAIRASRLGAQVTLIEKDKIGGTCLNRGCIPTKIMLKAVQLLEEVRESAQLGLLEHSKVLPSLPGILRYKENTVSRLTQGVRALLSRHSVSHVEGTASLMDNRTVHIQGTDQKIEADHIILATGSTPALPPIDGIDLESVGTTDRALELSEIPKRMVVIGGGVIGLEFGQIFHCLGAEITVIEQMDQILPGEDQEMTDLLKVLLQEQGLGIHNSTNVIGFREDKDRRVKVLFTTEGKEQELVVDMVLLATGRRPFFDGLNLDNIGLKLEKDAIVVDEYLETSVPGIFAAGDCIGGMMVAHLAIAEGELAAKNALGAKSSAESWGVPRCIYTSPEFAAVGLTEEEAKDGRDLKIVRFPLKANPKSLISNKTRGMIKFIIDSEDDRLLGVSMLGPHATELIGLAALGLGLDVTAEEIAGTVFAHPTVSESFKEAAQMAGEGPIHV